MIEHTNRKYPVYLGVFLISFATLMLEIGMTRIFSILYEYHYAFLVVSLAILGLGAGGIFFHIRLKNTKYENFGLKFSGMGFGLAVLFMLLVVVSVPGLNIIYFSALLAFLPFLFSGIFLSASFERLAKHSGKLYAVDLIGAALGSFLVIYALKLGGIAVALMAGLIASLASIILSGFEEERRIKKKLIRLSFLPGAFLILFLSNVLFGFFGRIPFSVLSQKEMLHLIKNPLYDAKISDTRWSHFGRTDLVKNKNDQSGMVFFIDGTAGAFMYQFDGDFGNMSNTAVLELKNKYTGYFPISLLPSHEKRSALIIGPGGGRDILAAKLAGVDKITAVEINPDLVYLARKYDEYNGGIFKKRDDINVIVDEGRSFLKRSGKKFDIILLSIPITKTSRSPEGYALSENFLFTVDSMNDYLENLNENGRVIVVAHHDLEIFKLIFLALEVFKQKGISPQMALKHIYTTGPPMFQVFVLKKTPITEEEAEIIHNKAMLEMHYQTESMFIPYVSQHLHSFSMGEGMVHQVKMLNEIILGISEGKYNPEDVIKTVGYDLRPDSDNSPFFYKMRKGLPEKIVVLLIFTSFLTAFALLIRPRFKPPKKRILYRRDSLFRFLFFSIGAGFMLIEIPLIQKFTLFLGLPIYSLSTLIFSLLIGAGLGSYISGRIEKPNSVAKLAGASLIIALIVSLYISFLPAVFDKLLGATITVRVLVSGSLIFPLGFMMGIPFPTGIRLIHKLRMSEQVPRMWGINGFSSVLGSVLAVALAILWGFHMSLIFGVFLYLAVAFIFLSKRNLFDVL